jgi:hypothetical protein
LFRLIFSRADIVVGMAHRGRINVLTNVMGKPFQNIFREFLHGTIACLLLLLLLFFEDFAVVVVVVF